MLKIERRATEEELDSLLVDRFSFKRNADGLMEQTDTETLTMRELMRREPTYVPWVIEYVKSPRDRFFSTLNMQRTGDELL